MMVAVVSNNLVYRPERRPIDLLEERDLGGHAIEEHVGKSESYLKGRVRDEADRTIVRGKISWSWRNIVHFVERGKSARQFDH